MIQIYFLSADIAQSLQVFFYFRAVVNIMCLVGIVSILVRVGFLRHICSVMLVSIGWRQGGRISVISSVFFACLCWSQFFFFLHRIIIIKKTGANEMKVQDVFCQLMCVQARKVEMTFVPTVNEWTDAKTYFGLAKGQSYSMCIRSYGLHG